MDITSAKDFFDSDFRTPSFRFCSIYSLDPGHGLAYKSGYSRSKGIRDNKDVSRRSGSYNTGALANSPTEVPTKNQRSNFSIELTNIF